MGDKKGKIGKGLAKQIEQDIITAQGTNIRI